MSPATFFVLAMLLTGAAAAAEQILRRFHRNRLRKLASQWEMNYSPLDQFRLTARVARNFPVPGAARIRVQDLIYGTDDETYRYVFTAEYTAGILTGKTRVLRAGSLSESRERCNDAMPCKITLAPANLPLLEQYRKLKPSFAKSKE